MVRVELRSEDMKFIGVALLQGTPSVDQGIIFTDEENNVRKFHILKLTWTYSEPVNKENEGLARQMITEYPNGHLNALCREIK